MRSRAVIFTNGLLPDAPAARSLIRPDDVILAADGGTLHVLALELMPAGIIGDLDSLTPAARSLAQRSGVQVLEFPRDKDETDLELALQVALRQGFMEIAIVAALGGRLDQTLANLALLADPELANHKVYFDDGIEEVFFTRDKARISGVAGDIVSLIPWSGPVTGVRTRNLRWPLRSETLDPYRTRGISNEMLGKYASMQIDTGVLLIVHRRNTNG